MPRLSEDLRATLEAEFPGWRFIVSDKGRYWALRGPLPLSRLNARDAADADTVEELRKELRTLSRRQPEPMFPPICDRSRHMTSSRQDEVRPQDNATAVVRLGTRESQDE